ncbi:hypothetical protein ILUMI_14237, partial [Ignelater luminosus]
MLPYAKWEVPLQFVFQQDNDLKHALWIVQESFEENNVHVMNGSAQSSDLNPIGNMWDEVERRIRTNPEISK